MRRALALMGVVSLCCATQRPAPPATPAVPARDLAKPEAISADSPRATPAGATFTAPAGWTLSTHETSVVLAPPETDSHVAIVDVAQDGEAEAAVAAAWKAYRPGAARPVRVAMDQPGRNGWTARRVFVYETSPNERLTVTGLAMRGATGWTVVLIEGSEGTLERRAGPVGLIVSSLRPKGYTRESFAGKTANKLDAARVEEIRKFVEAGAATLGVPGVAFSLVQDGKVVYEGGVGVRALGKPEKVDASTLFLAASNTKSLTTLLLAKLVDEKKLSWDEPVTQAYPAFRLGDAATTSQVRVKHLVCACTGLPRQDLEWLLEFANATPESSMKLLSTMQPTSKVGEVFQYSNVLAAAAGYIAGHTYFPDRELGAAYDAAMAEQIFRPLGMTSTTFEFPKASSNVALPHGLDIDGNVAAAVPEPNLAIVAVRPAGGMWTTAHDLTKYIQLELAGGKLPSGRQLVSQEALAARREPQVILREDQTYGMGLMVDRSKGIPVVHHGGDMIGYHSDMFFLPENGVGAVILTNGDPGAGLRGPFMRKLLEVLFDGRPEAQGDLEASAVALHKLIAAERARLGVPADATLAAKLAPAYRNAVLGPVKVERTGGRTVFDFGEWKSEVATRVNDDGSVSFLTIATGLDGLEFVAGEKGGAPTLTTRDGQHEYLFEAAR